MSRSRPTNLEKFLEHKVNNAYGWMEGARKELEAAERAAKTPDDPDVVSKRHHLAEFRKLWQEAIDERNGR
jgi:hypothetical protein